jgi:O-antigen ligase
MSAVVPDDLVAAPRQIARPSERAYQAVLTGALGSLGFFVLFSTAGTSISLFVLAILCLLAPARALALAPWREPVLAAGLALLAYITLRTFVGEGFSVASLGALNRYHELLMIPVLWVLMRLARRPQAFATGLMAGALFFAALHWLAPLLPQLGPFLASRRISAGFGLAVCAYLLFEHGRLGALPRWLAYGASVFLGITVIFASEGRTGHVVLLVLLGCAAYRAAPRRLRLPVVMAILVSGLLLASMSGPVRQRLSETLADARASNNGEVKNTSTGARIELFRNGVIVARQNWVIGTGWQTYPKAIEQVASPRHANAPRDVPGALTDNPHNEYLMQLGAGGLPSLLLFALWLALPLWRALREPDDRSPWAGAVGAVALAFATGCLFNSMLLDFVEGHFYGALLAWLLVRRLHH